MKLNQKTMKKKTKVTEDGKVIEETIHEDGTKSIKINVSTLKINETDEESLKAKEVIEKSVLPQLGVREVSVTVVHKPTNQFVSSKINLAYFQPYVKACFDGFPDAVKDQNDFLVVIHDGNSVQVASLDIEI